MATRNLGPKRSPFERDRDLAKIAKLYLAGKEQSEIAQILNADRPYSLSQQTISNDLKAVRREWMSIAIENYDKTKQIELARIEEDEGRILDAWDRSQTPRMVVMRESRTDGTIDRQTQEEPGTGDTLPPLPNVGILHSLDRVRARRCAIVGFGSHQKHDDLDTAIWAVLRAGYEVKLPGQ